MIGRGKYVAPRPKGRKTRLFGRAVPLALVVVLVTAGVAWADNLQNDFTAGGSDTITVGGSTTVAYRLVGNSAPSGDIGGCNVDGANPATVTISAPAAVSNDVSGTFQFTACGSAGAKEVQYSSLTPGDYAVSVSISGGKSGALYNNQANFTLHVLAASDSTAPTVTLATDPAGPDGNNGWFVTDPVEVSVTASDTQSNIHSIDCTVDSNPVTLADTSGIGTSMSASGEFDVTGDGTHSVSCTATDTANNTSSAATLTVKIDETDPTITINTPPNNATYILGEVVNADYECDDQASGLASCVGDVTDGAAIDTSSVGAKTFTVDAEDNAGNDASATHDYNVAYGVCALYDQDKAHQANSTVPIKLFLCDADGNNVSDADVVVQATSLKRIETDTSEVAVLEDSGNANPDNNFRYSSELDDGDGGYIFNLSTKNPSPSLGIKSKLASGQYKLTFKVDGQPSSSYAVYFWVK